MFGVRRREFITLLGGVAVGSAAARAQQGVRLIGILMNLAADDPEGQARVAAFLQGLQEAGWVVGRNARIDIRWGTAVGAFARSSHGGLIVTIGTLTDAHRDMISALATRYRLPAVYPFPFFVRSGGLISYGPDITDSYRRAAGYVDRILKGEKPADLPVQQPTKIDLAINLKAAKALGLEIPRTMLARADEVIE